VERKRSRSTALKREAAIKALSRTEKLSMLNGA
jgi:predicted GIY-YIG superfamily endonuclease